MAYHGLQSSLKKIKKNYDFQRKIILTINFLSLIGVYWIFLIHESLKKIESLDFIVF